LVNPEEVAEAFAKLREDGKVRAFGVSNSSAGQMELLKKYGVEIAANQMQFSLMHTPMIDAGFNVNMYEDVSVSRAGDTLEYCRTRGISLQAWSPLGYGFLEGIFIGNEKFPRLNATLEVMAAEKDCTPAALAIAWVLRHPAFGQAVTGTTNPERMKELCKAADVTLTREEWYRLYLANERVLP
jgi:predicted oxidoreductase